MVGNLAFHNFTDMAVPYDTPAAADGHAEACEDVVDTVPRYCRIADAPFTLADHHPQDLDILARDITFPPYVDLVVECKQAAVQDVGLPCHAMHSGIW